MAERAGIVFHTSLELCKVSLYAVTTVEAPHVGSHLIHGEKALADKHGIQGKSSLPFTDNEEVAIIIHGFFR